MINGKSRKGIFMLVMLMVMVVAAACGGNNGNSTSGASNAPATQKPATEAPATEKPAAALSGEIKIDGSSTVFPLSEAAAEEFNKLHKDVRVSVGTSGTGGGFKQFCANEIVIADASRYIKDSEAEACKTAGVEFTELEIAYDGLTVVVSKENDFIDHLTVEELNKIFLTGSTVKTWKDVRDTWPDENIVMFSPGADSGTYDYFNEAILDKEGIRNDGSISFSEDDNVLVQGVAGSKYGIGYFGFSYYEENKDKLKAVPVDGGTGAISPTLETIKDGSYAPLSRPLLIYVNNAAYDRPEVLEFTKFYIDNIKLYAEEVGYVPLPDEEYAKQAAKINA